MPKSLSFPVLPKYRRFSLVALGKGAEAEPVAVLGRPASRLLFVQSLGSKLPLPSRPRKWCYCNCCCCFFFDATQRNVISKLIATDYRVLQKRSSPDPLCFSFVKRATEHFSQRVTSTNEEVYFRYSYSCVVVCSQVNWDP